ncbi:putative multi antimicrobial extrusion protein (MatE) [Bradyrhizobium sp. STM 3843]|nr:putative multi antimicrobial extrusion protein (MatE) [Bradyrhizobium sp. STM 3843]
MMPNGTSRRARRVRLPGTPRMRADDARLDARPAPQPAAERSGSSSEVPLWREMVRFAIPQTASAALQLLSGTITAIYFGQLLGRSALAVASAFFPVFFLLVSFLIGLISGGIVLVARAHGAGDALQVKSVTGTTLSVCALLSIAIAIVGYLVSPELLAIMATPSDIMSPAIDYARVTFVSLPALTLLFAYTFLLRGTGDAQTPLLLMTLYIGLTLVLTPALIQGWFGLPQVGVTSAPWASLIACAVSLPVLVAYLQQRRHPMALDRELIRQLRINRNIAAPFFGIGVPSGIQTAVTSLSEVAMVTLINPFGSGATAAYGAVNQVVGYLLAPMQAVGLAATVFAAQAIGARKSDRLGAVTRIGIVLDMLVGIPTVIVIGVFSTAILSWFVVDPATLAIAERALLIVLWSYVVVGINDVLAGIMRSTGTVVWPTVIVLAGIWLVQLPAAYLLSRSVGLEGVWMGYPAGFVAALIAQVAYFGLVWRRRTHGVTGPRVP